MAGVSLRLRTINRRARLDAALANGADPTRDPALALRAQQLTGMASRRAIAHTIRNLVAAAEAPREAPFLHGSRPPLQREAVLAAREDLLAVARQLTTAESVSGQAAALAAQLVWDAASPVYAKRGVTVGAWAQTVLASLAGSRVAA